ncbi:MAG: glutathione S-transferase family protein [Pseudomonadales bacterium]|nr:glutathione S-transferase family protein [Pseudomonadales bacterium]
MMELVTLPAAFGMRNVSPFCLKTEMLLTSLGLPFTMSELGNPGKAPKGKLPFLISNGQRIADSELITEFLDNETQGQVYAGLSKAQKAQGVALSRLAEDHLYWLMVASRWVDDRWWPNVVEGFFGALPALVRKPIAGIARRRVIKTMELHGLGKHSLQEQKGFARRDLEALAAAVPAEGFLFAEKPNIYDFTVAAMMAGIYDNQPATWVTDLAVEYENLRVYTERVQAAVGVWGRE